MVSLRKVILAGAALFGAFLLPAAASAQQQQQFVTAFTTADLNLREGPGTEFRVIVAMPRGSQVQVSYCSNQDVWCYVLFGQRSGWASSRYLSSTAPQYAQAPPQPQYPQPQYQQPQYQQPQYQQPQYQQPQYQQPQVAVPQPAPPPPTYNPYPQPPYYLTPAYPYPYPYPYRYGAWWNFWFR